MNTHHNEPPILIVRGDLRTNFGYSKALRAHSAIIQEHVGAIFGVDIHSHPEFSTVAFPWPIISDAEASVILDRYAGPKIVLNYTTPDGFIRHEKARNIGMFYWETDRFNEDLGWAENILNMDTIWLPSSFMEDHIRAVGFTGEVSVVPWPHESQIGVASYIGVLQNTLVVDQVIKDKAWNLTAIPFDQVMRNHRDIYLSVTQNIPRKGLSILFSEWLRFKSRQKENSALLIKLSSFFPGQSIESHLLPIVRQIDSLSERFGVFPTDVYLCNAKLSDTELLQLYGSCSALVATTLGEGFGGPIVECGLQGTPVLFGDHSALQEYIPKDYPLIMDGTLASVSLRNQLPFYSISSRWFVPEYGELERVLGVFSVLSQSARNSIGAKLADKIRSVCDPLVISETIKNSIGKIHETPH